MRTDDPERGEAPFRLAYVLPVVLLLAVTVLPLALGTETLYYRDTLRNHLTLRAGQLESAAEGGPFALVDPLRSHGQPLAGNANVLAFYPTSALGFVAPILWAHNAHFWLHWLLAPFAVFWLGRRLGLGRRGAWAAGTFYATSGFFLSLLNLYNLVSAAVVLPALLAAGLALAEERRRRDLVATALLWALLVVAGEPIYAVLGAVLLALAVWIRRTGSDSAAESVGRTTIARLGGAPLVLALVLGTLLAAPLWVELLRILPGSFRGEASFPLRAALAQSWNPWTAVEWLLPLAFGSVDVLFWGERFFGGNVPLLPSLHPGWLVPALMAASGLPRLRRRSDGPHDALRTWSWCAVALGAFLALGFHNPLLRALHGVLGTSFVRYPVKLWVAVALGLSLLAGLGFERLLYGRGRRPVLGVLAAGLALLLAVAAWLTWMPGDAASFLAGFEPRMGNPRFAAERVRLAAQAWTTTFVLAALLGTAALLRRARLAAPLLLMIHAGSQLLLLQPLHDTDDAHPYLEPSPVLELVEADERIVHGGVDRLFGTVRGDYLSIYPDARHSWLLRTTARELYPFAGIPLGLPYAFVRSPEGLDSNTSIRMGMALRDLDDAARLRVLESAGVDVLLLPRPLAPELLEGPEAPVELRGIVPGVGDRALHVYGLRHPAPEALLATQTLPAPNLRTAIGLLASPEFEARRMATIEAPSNATRPPSGPGAHGARPHTLRGAEIIERTPERWRVRTRSNAAGVLVLQQAHLPIWRAEVDGKDAPVLRANGQLLGVPVPAGEHEVEVYADRRPTIAARAVSILALVALLFLARPGLGGRRAAEDSG